MGTLHGGAGLQSVGRRSRSQTRMQVQRRARVGWTALRARSLHARLPNDSPETLMVDTQDLEGQQTYLV